MGKLVTLRQVDQNGDWYFHDAYYSSSRGKNGGYIFDWPNPSFPYCHHIHQDHLTNEGRIKIRRWIEHNIVDTIIYDYLELNYRRHYGESRDWDSGHNVSNKWMRFFFENENTSLMFKMVFSDLITKPTKHHPDRPQDEEWCNTPIGER